MEMGTLWCLADCRGSDLALSLILQSTSSRVRLKRMALRGQPCLTPA